MKIERINENQIRCTLTSFDLSVRNLNLGELAYGSENARGLFREMIQKASNEVGFEAEDIPLMVEAIPLSNESVMLVITKIEDPEELDTRFSKFSPFLEEEPHSFFSDLTNEMLEGAEGLLDFLKKDMLEIHSDVPVLDEESLDEASDAPPLILTRIYRFRTLDQVTDAAAVASHIYSGKNTLFKNPSTSYYHLLVSSDGGDPLSFSRICNILAEYGEKLRSEVATEAYYQEHYEVILPDQALQKLASI